MKKQLNLLSLLSIAALSILLVCCKKDQEQSASALKTLQTPAVDLQVQEIMVPVPERGKWGVIGKTGQWIIKPQFDFVEEFKDGLARVNLGGKNYFGAMTFGGQWGFIDKTGKWVIGPQFDEVGEFEDGLARARIGGKAKEVGQIEGGKWGFIDKTGAWVINPQFDFVDRFKADLAALGEDLARANLYGKQEEFGIVSGGRWGFIDKSGRWVISAQFDAVSTFWEGLAEASIGGKPNKDGRLTGGKYGFIDKAGKWIINPGFDSVGGFMEGLAKASIGGKQNKDGALTGGKFGFIDKTGKWVIGPQFDEVGEFEDGLAEARIGGKANDVGQMEGGKWGFIDRAGKWVISPQYDSVRAFEDGLAIANIGGIAISRAYVEGGKSGFINKYGEWVVNLQFAFIGQYNDGLARANIDGMPGEYFTIQGGKWGFIDKAGRWAISPQFDSVDDFEAGLAKANIGGKEAFVGAMQGGKWGVIDKKGSWVINPQFDDEPFTRLQLISGVLRIINEKKYMVYDRSGKRIWSEDTTEYKRTGQKAEDTIGTGFYVSADGYVLTNSHIIKNITEIRISGLNAKIVSQDILNDLALLKVSARPASCATFRKDFQAEVGEDICAYGFPLTDNPRVAGSMLVGIVSSLSGADNNVSQIQISIPTQPGNSGGPILDSKGHVVGILASKLDWQAPSIMRGSVPENVGIATNAMTIKAFLDLNNVPYKKSGWISFKKSRKKIAAEGQKIAVRIECIR